MNPWLIGLLALGLVFAAFIILVPLEPVLYQDTYYGKLKAACPDGCCESSVKQMETGGYHLARGKTCPAGFSRNTLKCPTSYGWCEPQGVETGPKNTTVESQEKLVFQGLVLEDDRVPIPNGYALRVGSLGIECGPSGHGLGGCAPGPKYFYIHMVDEIEDQKNRTFLHYVGERMGEDEENTEFEKYGVRIISGRFGYDAKREKGTAIISVFYDPDKDIAAQNNAMEATEITYSQGGGLALWTSQIHWYSNGTLHVHENNGRYEVDKSQRLDVKTQAHLRGLLEAADVAHLKDKYVQACEGCIADLPTETIEIRTPQLRKNIFIDDFESVPSALKQLMDALQKAAQAIPNPTPAPVPLEDGAQTSLAQGHAIQACGYDLRLTDLDGANGSRSDWRHEFVAFSVDNGLYYETLTGYGNETHVIQARIVNLNITVHGIQEPTGPQAFARSIRISVQCGNAGTK